MVACIQVEIETRSRCVGGGGDVRHIFVFHFTGFKLCLIVLDWGGRRLYYIPKKIKRHIYTR